MKTFKILIFMMIATTFALSAQNFPSMADQQIKLANDSLAYKDEGQGQIILCLHAVGHSSKDFQSLYQLPMDQYRIIALDFPGHGHSGKASKPISATYFEETVLEFIQEKGLKNIVIVGNSIGGAVAIRLAAHHPEVIHSLVLSNPGGLDKRGFIAPIFLKMMVHFFKKGQKGKKSFAAGFEKFYKKVLSEPLAENRRNEIIRDGYLLAPMLVEAWESFNREEEDLRPLIANIQCKVLFAWCMKDRYVQFGRSQKAIRQFKNASIVQYQAGHSPYLECPDLFLKDLNLFLKQME